jgi:hypothetical protein
LQDDGVDETGKLQDVKVDGNGSDHTQWLTRIYHQGVTAGNDAEELYLYV